MAIFTKDKLDKLTEIIQRHISWFIWRLFGNEYSRTDSSKVDVSETVKDQLPVSIIQLSFTLGGQEAILKESEWREFGLGDLTAAAKKPLTSLEEVQIKAAELSAQSMYRNLGNEIINGTYDKLAAATGAAVSEGQVRDIIKDKIKFGVLTNRYYVDVAHDIKNALKEEKRNWYRVATTEMHKARQAGVADAIINKKNVYQYSEGIDSLVTITLSPTACEDCKRLYLGPDGNPKIFKLTELLSNVGTNYIKPWRKNVKPLTPPVHPNSVIEGTVVEGNVIAATRMSYSGKIREIITAHGHTLSITPNHSVATLRGFIPACQIQKGDYLFSYSEGFEQGDIAQAMGFNLTPSIFLPQNKQYGPTQIEQVFHSLELVCPPVSVTRFGFEFHGDAAYGNSNIDIVYADSELRDRFKTTLFDQIDGLLLETAKFSVSPVSHVGISNSFSVNNGISHSQTIARHFSEVRKISSQPSNTSCFGFTTYLDTFILEMLGQFTTRDSSFCGELQKGLPSLVAQDQVVEIRDRNYSGHVYDLQTISGVIVAQNLIISNCFCRLRYAPPGWGWDKEGRFTMVDPDKAFKKKVAP